VFRLAAAAMSSFSAASLKPSARPAEFAAETPGGLARGPLTGSQSALAAADGETDTSPASCCPRLDQLAIRSAAARAAYADQRRTVLIKAGPFAKVPAVPLSSQPFICSHIVTAGSVCVPGSPCCSKCALIMTAPEAVMVEACCSVHICAAWDI
jgi:hypothetical protein